MCFSLIASFATAALTGSIGVVTVSKASQPRELPLAAIPLLFSAQQTVEGLLWMKLPVGPGGAVSSGLVLSYLVLAQTFWPLFSPLAMLLIEPDQRRRRLNLVWLALGCGVSAYFLWGLLAHPSGAFVLDGHIVYVTRHEHAYFVSFFYIAATCLPLLLSSLRALSFLGAVVLIGCATAYAFYWQAFLSVWCFFAAAASVILLFHFERAHRRRSLVLAL